ncbi:LOW QUALITY PROTEIN: 60S ribosomal protein L28-like [Haliotis rubra]|uniref:LOW QUALITY PROTEIN: 60S ribosomal protein L28-like n=1 Tax=Haliotis rubra TaxID=36100 RepID=UPI001EE523CE|nr:LOW QUALITY PROTEIN: 60S ribosomal protein L28-like [Haliotis rubra]
MNLGRQIGKRKNNLKGINSFRYNGLIRKKTLGVEPAKDGKGAVLVTRNSTGGRKPNKSFTRVELKRDPRRTFATIRKTIRRNKYRKDLKMAAVSGEAGFIRSQKPIVVKKAGSARGIKTNKKKNCKYR